MVKSRSLKINLRFSDKDTDLAWAANQYSINDLVVLAVKRYLGKTKRVIPLPKCTPITTYWRTAVVYEDSTPDVYEFLERIPAGQRSIVIKMLIRHAMERCDLRYIIGDTSENNGAKRKKSAKSIADASLYEKRPRSEGRKSHTREDVSDVPQQPLSPPQQPKTDFSADNPVHRAPQIPQRPSVANPTPDKRNTNSDSIFDFI